MKFGIWNSRIVDSKKLFNSVIARSVATKQSMGLNEKNEIATLPLVARNDKLLRGRLK